MHHPPLVVLGYSEAAMFLRKSPPLSVAGIISIHGSREFGVDATAPCRLDLRFDDVEIPIPNDQMAMLRAASRRLWAEQNGLIEVPPARSDVEEVIQFAETVRAVDGLILCHCAGGMSRAPATALVCLSVWGGPGTELECVTEIRRLRRGAVPHAGMIDFADKCWAVSSRWLCGSVKRIDPLPVPDAERKTVPVPVFVRVPVFVSRCRMWGW
jgi:predicted protein tyrosine phosphatase